MIGQLRTHQLLFNNLSLGDHSRSSKSIVRQLVCLVRKDRACYWWCPQSRLTRLLLPEYHSLNASFFVVSRDFLKPIRVFIARKLTPQLPHLADRHDCKGIEEWLT